MGRQTGALHWNGATWRGVNILNFSENIYHKEMRIEFVKYLRPEEKYDTIDALIAQMHKDREKTARILL